MNYSNGPLIAINITFVLTCILSIYFLLKAGFTDPGIIPRIADPLGEMLQNVPFAYK